MVRAMIDRIVAGDSTAVVRASTVFASADSAARAQLLDGLAQSAATSDACLELLLQLVDDHALDRGAIRRILVDNDQADDAHQDVLIAVAQSVGRYRGDAAFTTWLHSLARNVAVDHLRKRKETVPLDDRDSAPVTAAGRLSSLIASRSDLARAVNALPESYREAVVLRDIEQRSYREIAATLDTEMNTVKSRISRGRALVAAMMSEHLTGGLDDPRPAARGPGSDRRAEGDG